ncbi:MAG: IspD/TarI family cytidylyltransferase [Planctomycetota bacterium]
MEVCVILPAAGVGSRFSAGGSAASSKIEYEIAGRPAFLHAIDAFRAAGEVGQIVLAVHPDRLDDFRFRWGDRLSDAGVTLVAGGRVERWETVSLALEAVESGATHVAVHDAARPAVSAALIQRVLKAAARWPAVVPGLAVSSTLKRVETLPDAAAAGTVDRVDDILGLGPAQAGPEATDEEGLSRIVATVPRSGLVAVQTPQVFEIELLRRAYAQISGRAEAPSGSPRAKASEAVPPTGVTDDAGLVEALGQEVMLVEGDEGNVKITRPGDIELVTALMAHRRATVQKKAATDLFGDDDD